MLAFGIVVSDVASLFKEDWRGTGTVGLDIVALVIAIVVVDDFAVDFDALTEILVVVPMFPVSTDFFSSGTFSTGETGESLANEARRDLKHDNSCKARSYYNGDRVRKHEKSL